MAIYFTSYTLDDISGITVMFSDGSAPIPVASTHPNYAFIVDMLTKTPPSELDEELIREKVAPVMAAGQALKHLSDRIIYDNQNIYFDGDPLDNSISQHIVRIIQSGEGKSAYEPLVKFMEKLYTNPSKTSIKSLYDWLVRYNFTITDDGDFLAYKGVNSDGTSIHAGEGIVNGVAYERAHLPNEVDAVVEIPRAHVDGNAGNGCSVGLHAGTHEYASSFARGKTLLVKINPRDVVSVPEDAAYQKLRVCRYVVIKEIEEKVTTTTYATVTPSTDPAVAARVQTFKDAISNGTTVSFTYVDKKGVITNVTGFIPTDVEVRHTGTLITGEKDTGEFRSYYAESVQGAVTDDGDPFGTTSAAPAADEADEVLSDFVGADDYLAFDYTRRDGNVDKVASFLPVKADLTVHGYLVHGYNKAGENRSYYEDRVSNLVVNPTGEPVDTAQADDKGDTKADAGSGSAKTSNNPFDFGSAGNNPFGDVSDFFNGLAFKLVKRQSKKAADQAVDAVKIHAKAAKRVARDAAAAAKSGQPFDVAAAYSKRLKKEQRKAQKKR